MAELLRKRTVRQPDAERLRLMRQMERMMEQYQRNVLAMENLEISLERYEQAQSAAAEAAARRRDQNTQTQEEN